MLSLQNTIDAMAVRMIHFTPQEYMFVLQVVLGEEPSVAYASVFDTANFKRNIPSENEEEYLEKFNKDAEILLQQQQCIHLREHLEQEYKSEVQAAASNLTDFSFTSSDIQKLLNNLLRDRSESLSDSSVRDILALIRSMYDNGIIDSGNGFQNHFITIANKYNILCPQCNREGYAVEGLDFRCEHCGCIAKWDESQRRYFPNLGHL